MQALEGDGCFELREKSNPVAPAGYSLRPLVKKLGIASGMRAVFVNEPGNFRDLLGSLPSKVKATTQLRGSKNCVHTFAARSQELQPKLPRVVHVLGVHGMLGPPGRRRPLVAR